MSDLFDYSGDHRGRSLQVTYDYAHASIRLVWTEANQPATSQVQVTACRAGLHWRLDMAGVVHEWDGGLHPNSIRAQLRRLQQLLPVAGEAITFLACCPDSPDGRQHHTESLGAVADPWRDMGDEILRMGRQLQVGFNPPAQVMADADPETVRALERDGKRLRKREQAQRELGQRMAAIRARRAERSPVRQVGPRPDPPAAPRVVTTPALPVPPVAVRVEPSRWEPELALGVTGELQDYLLRERAARWWVSNQTDELLCLPHCAIRHLEYQLRTALRVIGALRGRALLSDEVGLGKTIEAGLVLKEYLTRGMVRRFLVLTLPSLIDQWQEELEEKFHIATVTTNQPAFRGDPAAFWREHSQIVASIHTLKQDAQLTAAQGVPWDMLIVDEAHYLRNRAAKTWQAVNALPRQFLLLLTATPVQNSIEDIYHLVTLLKPGQLPSPQEFRERFLNKDKPREPRDAEELRRLLGQVMIRNTRANAGLKLPPRRAETVMFEPSADERAFWERWEGEFRECLATLSASQASLWGRLLLQAAGSSPEAWREALVKFPDGDQAGRWRATAPLAESWRRKVAVLPPLADADGGLVVFTQFIHTQAALADALRAAGVPVWMINGQTPAAQRQPLTEEFRAGGKGGVLVLTHSGTEGRNLQFCHRLVNFDLPWNPMEIEQRIGRLHRLGQTHAVEIYNLVQVDTLQESLLTILQEKLNLFELVVGETGLILGDRFASEDFEEEVWRRWRDAAGAVPAAMQALGEDLLAARANFEEVKQVDQVLFERDYEAD